MAPTKILQYSVAQMTQALEDVAMGMAVATAAKKKKVPRVTLLYKYKGKYPISRKMGTSTAFTPEEEEILEKWVLHLQKRGFPVSKQTFLYSVQKLAIGLKKDCFKEKLPSKKWFSGFMARHPAISERVCQNLTRSRGSVSKNDLRRWSKEVEEYLVSKNLMSILSDPTRVFNADETAFFLNPKGGKVLAMRGDRNVYQGVGNDEKECLTVLINGNAAGVLAPPMVVYRYTRIPAPIAESVPRDWSTGRSEKGWMNYETFYEYVANVFYKWLVENSIVLPIIFFVDGHISHLSLEVSQFCSKHGIELIALHPNATHLIQPMDVAVFRSLKEAWKQAVMQWRMSHEHTELKKQDFCSVLKKVLDQSYKPETLRNGFRKCGLVPWNVEEVQISGEESETPRPLTSSVVSAKESHLRWLRALIGDVQRLEDSTDFEDSSLKKLWEKAKISDASEFTSQAPGENSLGRTDEVQEPVNETHADCEEVGPASARIRTPDKNYCLPEVAVCGPASETSLPGESSKATCVGGIIPSPFKKSLFWPGEKKTKSSRPPREKIPSVVTSAEWQIYHEKKSSAKKAKEIIKQARQQVRLENKRKKEEALQLKTVKNALFPAKKPRRSPSTSSSESSVSVPDLSDCEGDDWNKFSSEDELNDGDYDIGHFVIVEYEDQHFPGKIVGKLSSSGYEISAMAKSGLATFRWPEKQDILTYSRTEIKKKICAPQQCTRRGDFAVPEMKKYLNFVM